MFHHLFQKYGPYIIRMMLRIRFYKEINGGEEIRIARFHSDMHNITKEGDFDACLAGMSEKILAYIKEYMQDNLTVDAIETCELYKMGANKKFRSIMNTTPKRKRKKEGEDTTPKKKKEHEALNSPHTTK